MSNCASWAATATSPGWVSDAGTAALATLAGSMYARSAQMYMPALSSTTGKAPEKWGGMPRYQPVSLP